MPPVTNFTMLLLSLSILGMGNLLYTDALELSLPQMMAEILWSYGLLWTIGLELLILENFGDSGSETIHHFVWLEYDLEKHVINYNYNNVQLLRSPNNSLSLQCSVNITTCTMYHYGDLSYGYYNPTASEVKQILLAILGGNKPPPQLQLHTTPSV